MASIDRISLLELLRKSGNEGNVDFLREAMQVLVQPQMEAEVVQDIGAERYERNTERVNQRNAYRERRWDTRVGTSEIHGRKCLQLTFSISITEDIVMEEQLLRQIESIVKNKKNTFESEVTDILESITFIKIIVAIEKTCGFEFDDDMLLLSEFPTIGSLINYVVSKVESLNVQIKNV
ncbi:hypothetical protein CN939_18705 [Bacillus thuringiensis]|nr:transposase [Bacillus thuringiensis]PEF88702.1 hypothetical protein CON51_04705 [Bacillus thuringiensis]PES59994.1 hypothetical protein CN506_07340 [Bacillus thuringiensis]PFS64281.1 hypothetical protein COK64_04135 [Bacillus thuringiensis]PGL62431.1 hypothetical protein CN939_18705 [Bacillus thuringiensis]